MLLLPEIVFSRGRKMLFMRKKPVVVNGSLAPERVHKQHDRSVAVIFVALVKKIVLVAGGQVRDTFPVRDLEPYGRVVQQFFEVFRAFLSAFEIARVHHFHKRAPHVPGPDVAAVAVAPGAERAEAQIAAEIRRAGCRRVRTSVVVKLFIRHIHYVIPVNVGEDLRFRRAFERDIRGVESVDLAHGIGQRQFVFELVESSHQPVEVGVISAAKEEVSVRNICRVDLLRHRLSFRARDGCDGNVRALPVFLRNAYLLDRLSRIGAVRKHEFRCPHRIVRRILRELQRTL